MRRRCGASDARTRCKSIRETIRDFLAGLLVFLAVFALAALDAQTAQPAPAAATAAQSAKPTGNGPGLTPSQMRSGTLIMRPAGPDTAGAFAPVRRLDTDVEIVISGSIARAVVTQRFRNTSHEPAEGLYVFPLPEGASVDALSVQIGDRAITGAVKSRAEARRLYARARDTGAKASPVGQTHAGIFTTAVTNVAPGETVRVRIEYQEALRQDGGVTRLRFPLAIAPRYVRNPRAHDVNYNVGTGVPNLSPNGGDNPHVPPARHPRDGKIDPVSLQVKIDAGFPLGQIDSPTHALAIKRLDTDSALLTLEDDTAPTARDFELSWRTQETLQPTARLFHEKTTGGDYVMAMISPPAQTDTIAERPREIIFVVDTSGSMAGKSIIQARRSLELAIDRLGTRDRFNIIAFDSGFEALFGKPVPADARGKAIARHFVARLEASGGTELLLPLSAALKDDEKDNTARLRQVVLITDGAVADEQQLFSEIAIKRGRSRLFLVGIGSQPSSALLRRAAEIGRGSFIHIPAGNRIAQALERFLTRLERPAITDLSISWPKGARVDASPDPLPDLYAGEPLVVTAHVDALKGPVTVAGTVNGKPWSVRFDLDAARPGPGIGKAWARNKIASLEARRLSAGGALDADQAIEKLALEHHLVSRMTSLVALAKHEHRVQDDGTPLAVEEVPVSLPDGRAHKKIFGDTQQRPAQASLRKTRAPSMTPRDRTAAAREASTQQTGLLPADRPVRLADRTGAMTALLLPSPAGTTENASVDGTALISDRFALVGIMALIFAAMSALTLGMWRYLNRTYTTPRRAGRGI